jgi:hypothetical protein
MPRQQYTDGYRQAVFTDFSLGLQLRDKADAVKDGEAIDLLNVTFTERGAVRQRDGYVDLSATLPGRVDSMAAHYTTAGLRQLVLGAGVRLDTINETGATVGSLTGLTGGPWTFAQFGDPLRELVYAANGSNPLARWDGAAWSAGSALATVNGTAARALPKAGAITVTAAQAGSTSGTNASNRLVATAFGTQPFAGPGGVESTPSRVYFSNPGQPEIWETDGFLGTAGANYTDKRARNWIDLTPGDGEYITAAVTWRELVFLFKQTKFFVLWGEGTGSEGIPTFQVREVVNSIGLAAPQAVAVGRDGVYFMNRRGVYRTSGGDPVLLSDAISPMWTQDPEVYFRSQPINLTQLNLTRMLWHMERLYLAIPTGTATANDRVLVYDTQHQYWTLYDLPATALASFRSSALPEVHFAYADPLPSRIGHLALGQTTDRGQPIVSRWRSGWGDYGTSQSKTIRETKLWGRGGATISFSADFHRNQNVAVDTHFGPVATSWTYGQLTARGGTYTDLNADYGTYTDLAANLPLESGVDDALVRYAIRGIVFSTQFSNSAHEPDWSVHRIARHLREIRQPSASP